MNISPRFSYISNSVLYTDSASDPSAVGGRYQNGTVTMTRLPGATYQIDYAIAPLAAVAKHTRALPDKYINAEGNNVTGLFLDYARPLVGPLPVTARLNALRGRHA